MYPFFFAFCFFTNTRPVRSSVIELIHIFKKTYQREKKSDFKLTMMYIISKVLMMIYCINYYSVQSQKITGKTTNTSTAPATNGRAAGGGGGSKGAFGFGGKTTGGGRVTPQAPRDLAQLQAWLGDNVPRVILINRVFDFSAVGSNVTGPGCKPFQPCKTSASLVQLARDELSWCSQQKTPKGKSVPSTSVTYHPAAIKGILVGSQKTLLGVGSNGVIKGKGLHLHHSKNVIIQNIHFTWLNPHLVWGGDAIMLDGASNVWIDHCTFNHIGRQMIVTGGKKAAAGNTGITISNNFFSGRSIWSAKCNNKHYWALLFSGANDQLTVANNCIDSTSGRSPTVGGAGSPKIYLHYYNNLHTNSEGQIFNIHPGGNVLAEGNVFQNARISALKEEMTESGGNSYVPFKDEDAQRCVSILGRPCVTNLMVKSAPIRFGLKTQTLSALSRLLQGVKNNILPAAQVQAQAARGCGVGKI